MKRLTVVALALALAIAFTFGFSSIAQAEEKVVFSFEKDAQGWEIPEWALEQEDHVAKTVESSKDFAKDGKGSLKIMAAFPGKIWSAALVEDFEYFDWTPYKAISADIYIPKEAPVGLKGKIILTVGEGWKFIEMARSTALVPGEWVTITANLLPGSEDWKRTVVDDNFRKDVRKLAIRVESNKKPEYTGPIYIDNVRLVLNK
ncbi:MAG: hypothetical protein WC738_01195 [Candidatus Omnitrophota bacterium]|jgi:hypothetical protein